MTKNYSKMPKEIFKNVVLIMNAYAFQFNLKISEIVFTDNST